MYDFVFIGYYGFWGKAVKFETISDTFDRAKVTARTTTGIKFSHFKLISVKRHA